MTRTGANAGATSRVPALPREYIVSSHSLRLLPNTDEVDSRYLEAFLLSRWGKAQLVRSMTGAAQRQLQIAGISPILIVRPPREIQKSLVVALDAARAARRRKLEEAESLLAGLDGFVMHQLGLTLPPPHDPNRPFAVRLHHVRDRRLDPPAYTPFPIPDNPLGIPIERLDAVAAVDHRYAPKQEDDSAVVPYVGLPECDLNDVREVATRTYKEVRGRSVAHVGDILFARIEPSVFNKKYVHVEHLGGHDYAFLSTEFYAVRARGDDDDQKYLYAMFQSAFVYNQVRGKTTGSSGRRRIDPDLFNSLLIPWPDPKIRKAIAGEVARRRAKARRLRTEADALWNQAKADFEAALLGPEPSAHTKNSGRGG